MGVLGGVLRRREGGLVMDFLCIIEYWLGFLSWFFLLLFSFSFSFFSGAEVCIFVFLFFLLPFSASSLFLMKTTND